MSALEPCLICGTSPTNLCATCRQAHYCSRACQSQDWARHKKECRALDVDALIARLKKLPLAEAIEGLFNEGKVFADQAQNQAAHKIYSETLIFAKKAVGPDSLIVAKCYMCHAQVFFTQAKYDEALALLEKAKVIFSKQMGPASLEVAGVLGNIANCLRFKGDLEKARSLTQQVLEIFASRRSEVSDAELASVTLNLGTIERMTGNLEGSLVQYQRVIEICQSSEVPDQMQIAQAQSGIASVLLVQGKLEEAFELVEIAMVPFKLAYGGTHPEIARLLVLMADCLKAQNKEEEAMELGRRAASIYVKTLGENHPKARETLQRWS